MGETQSTNVNVKGIGGKMVKATMKGTVRWLLANDKGQVHEEYITNTNFHEDCPYCLYSPQHISQIANDHYPKPNGTYCITHADKVELHWDQATQLRTVPIHPKLNVFIMRSAHQRQIFDHRVEIVVHPSDCLRH